MTQTLEQPAPPARHPEVFDVDEAAAYLHLPNARAFKRRARQHGVKGVRVGRQWIFSKSQLDALKKMMFGEDGGKRGR